MLGMQNRDKKPDTTQTEAFNVPEFPIFAFQETKYGSDEENSTSQTGHDADSPELELTSLNLSGL